MAQIYRRLLMACCILLGALIALPTYAWDSIGHQLIAQIALDHLNPRVKKQVFALTNELQPQYGYSSFVRSASWADQIRGHGVEAFTPWHYINKTFSPDNTPLPSVQKQNIVWAILQAENVLQNPKAIPFEKAFFLRFLIHFVADIHQPLHCVSRVTSTLPLGDLGGNLFPIRYHKIHNLHKFWDRGAGFFTAKYHFPLKQWQIKKLARSITANYPKSQFKRELTELDPNQWAQEGASLAQTNVYRLAPGTRPSKKYIFQSRKLVKQKIALAGYRLAEVLNQIIT